MRVQKRLAVSKWMTIFPIIIVSAITCIAITILIVSFDVAPTPQSLIVCSGTVPFSRLYSKNPIGAYWGTYQSVACTSDLTALVICTQDKKKFVFTILNACTSDSYTTSAFTTITAATPIALTNMPTQATTTTPFLSNISSTSITTTTFSTNDDGSGDTTTTPN